MIHLAKADLLTFHRLQVERFGGEEGVLDEGALESALVAAQNRAHYEAAGLQVCAATYLWHLAKAHAFVDGNKRTAAMAMEVVVNVNGGSVVATDAELEELVLGVAAGRLDRDSVEAWAAAQVRAPAD